MSVVRAKVKETREKKMTNSGYLVMGKDGQLYPVHNLATARHLLSIGEVAEIVDAYTGYTLQKAE
jgi:phosphoglucomutase